MASIVVNLNQAAAMMTASKAIVLVSVGWSPGPPKSRRTLAALESASTQWSHDAAIQFFDLRPEQDVALNHWYDAKCAEASSSLRFALHGNGFGPFWWLANGTVLECITKPYDYPIDELQRLSAEIFNRL